MTKVKAGLMPRSYRPYIDYRKQVSVPIRDMEEGARVYCLVTVFGLRGQELLVVPGGSEPLLRAVKRLGLDPMRYQAMLWDIPTK